MGYIVLIILFTFAYFSNYNNDATLLTSSTIKCLRNLKIIYNDINYIIHYRSILSYILFSQKINYIEKFIINNNFNYLIVKIICSSYHLL